MNKLNYIIIIVTIIGKVVENMVLKLGVILLVALAWYCGYCAGKGF